MNKQEVRRRIFLVVAILWLVFIWGNSLQTADESSQVSAGILAWLTPLLAQTGLPEEYWHTLVRKLAHMTEFAVAGLLWSAALQTEVYAARSVVWFRRGTPLLICLGIAVIDETIQRFVPGRSGELRDVCIDLLGAVMGILVTMVVAAAGRRRKLRGKV